MSESLLALLQFSDGLFPAGGFAHSMGLETYVQSRMVADRTSLEDFLVAQLEGTAGPADAVAVALVARHAAAGDVDAMIGLDERLEAMKIVPELRAASRQMGRQTARVAAALGDDGVLYALDRAVETATTPGHHAVAFGAVTGRALVDPELAAAAFLQSTCALLVGAALRLLPLGQLEGQRLLASLRPRVARLAAQAARSDVEDMWSFTPALEIAGVRHADLEARLFRS